MADTEMVKDEAQLDIEDELEIEIVDDSGEEDRPAKSAEKELDPDGEATDEEIAAYGSRAQKRINKLVWERHEERRRREAQERLANEALSHADRLTKDNQRLIELVEKSRGAIASETKKRAEMAIAAAQAKFKKAYEEGDPDLLAEAQKELTDAQIALRSVPAQRTQKVDIDTAENNKPKPQARQERQERQEEPQVDPRAKQWYEKNPWFNQDIEMTSFAYGVHEKLVRDGVDPNSDAYYNKIDQRMREVFPNRFEGSTAADTDSGTSVAIDNQSSQGKKPSTPVARATRSNGHAPRKITLTETQVRIAKRLGVPLKEYAKQLLAEQQKL